VNVSYPNRQLAKIAIYENHCCVDNVADFRLAWPVARGVLNNTLSALFLKFENNAAPSNFKYPELHSNKCTLTLQIE
jgi:hypothetical protein